jgi:hypothetical protein
MDCSTSAQAAQPSDGNEGASPDVYAKRKAIPKRMRFEVLRRDGHTCLYCGSAAPDVKLTVDHVVPVALGGVTDPSNLVAACFDCNAGKAAMAPDQSIVAAVDDRAMALAQALEMVRLDRMTTIQELVEDLDFFQANWNRYHYADNVRVPLPVGWRSTVEKFMELGLCGDEFGHYIDVAMGRHGVASKDRFRYFCGCCWKELGVRQEMALAMISDMDEASE